MPTLILTPRHTPDSQALWRAAGRLGWQVHRLTTWRVPEELRTVDDPVLYAEALFAPTLAHELGISLLEPPDDWLCTLPLQYAQRAISLSTLHDARSIKEPRFIKPPNDKSFPARVCSGSELPTEFDPKMPVLVSDVVRWNKEFRFFILDRARRTGSLYSREGTPQRDEDFEAVPAEMTEAESFVDSVLHDPRVQLPRAAVLDVGLIHDRGWAVVEQNAAWGAGIYGCDPAQVLGVLRVASNGAR